MTQVTPSKTGDGFNEVHDWIESLDEAARARVIAAIDKAGRWNEWYREAIPLAEQRYETYLKERAQEEQGGQP